MATFSVAAWMLLCGGVKQASASAATTTTLAVTSGGKAVTTVTSGSVITLTATVMAGSNAVMPGQVNFCDASAKYCTDIHLLGTAQLSSSGTAVLRFIPGIGSHSYKAVFLGTTGDAASSSSASALTVTGSGTYPTTTSITQSGSTGNYTLTAAVSGAEGITPTGTVSFLDTNNSNYVLATAALGAGQGNSGLSFANSSNPVTNPYPQAVAVGDFNGDGKADLVVPVGDTVPSVVSILLGNGDGTFKAGPVTPITATDAGSVAVGDFNGDGKADLAVTLPDNYEVLVMLGNGDGSFPAGQMIQDADGPAFVTTGDFNGDGKADLAVANPASEDVTILLGKGDGAFTTLTAQATGTFPVAIAVGDFNGDGKADLALANDAGDTGEPSSVTILLGNGDGTFTQMAESPATGDSPTSIAAGDFNGDGKADLAITNSYVDTGEPGSVTILLGNGDGTFTTAPAPATDLLPYSVAVADFNGDGKADLVTANAGSNTATVLLGNGDGTFTQALSPAAGSDPLFVAVGDFNGDGSADLAVVNNNTNSVTVLLSQMVATATATASGISAAGTGSHMIGGSYSGDSIYGASVSGTTGISAAQVMTTLSLSANPTNSNYGQQVVLTATLNPYLEQGHNASGTVTFNSGSTSLGTGTLSSGVATLNVTSLPAGTDSVVASYAGDADFAASTSPAVSETVVSPGFSIAFNPASLTVKQGGTGSTVLTITPTGGFNQSLQLNCSGLPANATCTFSPASITPSGAAINSTLTVTTNVQTASSASSRSASWLAGAIFFVPGGFASGLGLLGLRRKKVGASGQSFLQLLLVLGVLTMAVAVTGCGGNSGGSPGNQASGSSGSGNSGGGSQGGGSGSGNSGGGSSGGGNPSGGGSVTPAGTSTVTVTASSMASGGLSQQVNLTLTIAD